MLRTLPYLVAAAALVGCQDAADLLKPTSATSHSGPPSYQWVSLPLPRGATGYATAIANNGQVVGWVVLNSDQTCPCHAFSWQDTVMQDLGTLGGRISIAVDVNEIGQIVGYSQTEPFGVHAFLWENGAMTDLGTLAGGDTRAVRANNAGQIIGWSADAPSFLWQAGVMQPLPLSAAAINARGQIAGWATTDPAKRRAAVWQGGTLTDLGTLGGDESWATAINNNGAVAGASRTASGELHAFLWSNGQMRDLGVPPGSVAAEAVAVNEKGQVSGTATGADGYPRGFFWEKGIMQDIGTLGKQTRVFGMNRQGALVGWSDPYPYTSQRRAVAWQNGVLVRLADAGYVSVAVGVNDAGVVAGWTAKGSDETVALPAIWRPASGGTQVAARGR
jgi:probable HAF family extracellular repeat protein